MLTMTVSQCAIQLYGVGGWDLTFSVRSDEIIFQGLVKIARNLTGHMKTTFWLLLVDCQMKVGHDTNFCTAAKQRFPEGFLGATSK